MVKKIVRTLLPAAFAAGMPLMMLSQDPAPPTSNGATKERPKRPPRPGVTKENWPGQVNGHA